MMQRVWFILGCAAVICAAFPMMLWLAIMMQFWPLWTAGFNAIAILFCFCLVVCAAFGLVSAMTPDWKREPEPGGPAAPKKTVHRGGKR